MTMASMDDKRTPGRSSSCINTLLRVAHSVGMIGSSQDISKVSSS